MVRSRLKNKANKTGNPHVLSLYRKQRNHVVNLNRKAKRQHFRDLGTSSDFWKSTKTLFSKKSQNLEKIFLLDNSNKLIEDETTIAEIFNDYFVNIASKLDVETPECCHTLNTENGSDLFRNHLSIKRITESFPAGKTFSFREVGPDQVYRTICKLNQDKTVSGPFSIKIIKMVADLVSDPISKLVNTAIQTSTFPQSLKCARVTPVFKKDDKFLKENYRPISILPAFSKIYERIMHDQLSSYFDSIFDPRLCGFRSKYSTQHALIRMIGQWHKCLDKSGKAGAVLMDLSKAFDCIDHKLLVAKLSAYELDEKSLKLIKCYLTNRYQRTKIGSKYSRWSKVILGVPQGSILGPLLFNIFINDLFLFIVKSNVCNFADDNSLFSCEDTLEEVLFNLEYDLLRVLNWFSSNGLAANPSKFQMLIIGNRNIPVEINIGHLKIKSKDSVELLGVNIDSILSFSEHIKSLCTKAKFKIWSLNRIRSYLSLEQRKLIFNAYIMSLFNYTPIIWMFHNKTSYAEITRVHKRALRSVLCDFNNSYEVLLENSKCKSIHEIHLSVLLCEVFKSVKNLNPKFMQQIFKPKTISYNLRNQDLMTLPPASSQRYGTQSFIFRGSLLWNQVPHSAKSKPSIVSFKSSIKNLNLLNFCHCKICM